MWCKTKICNLFFFADIAALANREVNPPYKSVFYLWEAYRKERVGSHTGEDVLNNIKEYAKSYDGNIELIQYGESFSVAVVSPFMRRVHSLTEASEICFVDTTLCVDKTNTSVTLLMTRSSIGALPLAVTVSTGQDEVDYLACFSAIKKILGNDAFGENKYPQVFMTDDGEAEKNALHRVWPNSKQCLCFFHILQVS